MAKQHKPSSKRRHLRQYITDMVNNIEEVMVNINTVLGEVNVLVQQIDSITERMENKYGDGKTFAKGNVILDANQNACDVIETPGLSNISKNTFPSPYMDYTYLELANDCNTCNDNLNSYSFRYNEKYPLWIQCETWKTDHSVSDMSEVSSGSDSNSLVHNDGYGKSWISVSNVGKTTDSSDRFKRKSRKSKNGEDDINVSKCCHNSHDDLNEKYCGVYEHIMEQQLEDLDSLAPDLIKYPEINGSFSSISVSSSGTSSNKSLTNCDYYPDVKTTRLRNGHIGVTVRECSDSNLSLTD